MPHSRYVYQSNPLLNQAGVEGVLAKLGGRANKHLGQHFLIDSEVLETIVEAADTHPGDLVLEIGPGLGVLTRELLAQGAEVLAIEKDRRFVEYLNMTLLHGSHLTPLPPSPALGAGGSDRIDAVEPSPYGGEGRVRWGDAATIDWHELIGNRPWKLVSNLPYSITSLALRKALWSLRPASRIVVLVQREVAERALTLTPSPTPSLGVRGRVKGSLLSLMVALASESARIVKRVAPSSFYPPPKVESAILEIIPMLLVEREKRWGIDPEKIMTLAKKGFTHPRKKLASNLGLPTGLVASLPISQNTRAEELSPDDWARLAKKLENFKTG